MHSVPCYSGFTQLTECGVHFKNDDGPPGHESPYIYGLYRHLTQDLGIYHPIEHYSLLNSRTRMGCEGGHPQFAEVMDRCVRLQRSTAAWYETNVGPVGKAYHIKDIINGRYYYPHDPGTPCSNPLRSLCSRTDA